MPHNDFKEDDELAASVSRMHRAESSETLIKPEKMWVPAGLVLSIIGAVWILAGWVSENKQTIVKLKEENESHKVTMGLVLENKQTIASLREQSRLLSEDLSLLRKECWMRKHQRQWVREAKRAVEVKDWPDVDDILKEFE